VAKKIKVFIIESESGWGQRIDEVKEFTSVKAARKFSEAYNRKYNPPKDVVPDWYMYAKVEDV